MHYVIIGNGAAGIAAAQTIEKIDSRSEITIITDEPYLAYYRPLIPLIIDEERSPEEICRDKVELPRRALIRTAARAKRIDSKERTVLLDDGDSISYDRLLIAIGSSPRSLPVPGVTGHGVFFLRRLEDALAVKEAVRNAKRAVVVGGGRIGSKAAVALNKLGVKVSVVEKLDRLMPPQLDKAAASFFEKALQELGIEIITGQGISQILRQDGAVIGVLLEDGRTVAADMVLIAVGVKSNTELAQQAGIQVSTGIVVDSYMRTNVPVIYAAGDVVETTDVVSGEKMVSGIWTNAVEMGQTAGENMAGGKRESKGAFSVMNAMELAGLAVISVGMIHPPAGKGYEVLVERKEKTYRKFVFRNDVLVGVLLVGKLDHAGTYTSLIREKTELGALKDLLPEPTFSYAPFLKIQSPLIDNYIS